ncbi:MAG: hypothetical protein GC136_00500 [Alphaproteobacteria bacterium]|nr:hypothetical protein [Alphaproteobacteria bacterium]
MVTEASSESAKAGLRSGNIISLRKEDVIWAQAGKGLKAGDVVLVETAEKKDNYYLRQIPLVQGGLVAIDPHTGRVLAMQGGWGYEGSVFNRVTQAYRQPGSAFKPFVYLAALDKGYTPSSRVVDGPITYTDSAGNVWQPENYHNDYLGPTPIRVGVEKSRNLMTIRLAQQIGMDAVMEYASKFGIGERLQRNLSNVLGAGETTLLKLTNAYAMLVNGGQKIEPTFIDRIQDRYGETIYKNDERACVGCGPKVRWERQDAPAAADNAEQIADPRTAYQMVSILEGVVQRGTATRLKDLGRPVGGKTGTTNDSKDAWFIGFTPDLAVGVYVGFDQPKSLGEKETGSSVAVPIFKSFMQAALKDVPPAPFRIPAGIKLVRVNPRSGERAAMNDPQAIWEAYVSGTEPADIGSYAYEPVNPLEMQDAYVNENSWDAPYNPNAMPAEQPPLLNEPQSEYEQQYQPPASGPSPAAPSTTVPPLVPMAPPGSETPSEDEARGFHGVY